VEKTMKIKSEYLISVALVLLVTITLLSVPTRTFAAQTATLSVNPTSGVMAYPTYTTDVMITPVTNLNSIHFKLSFNNGTNNFLQVGMQDVKLGAIFAGQQLNMSVGIYHLTDTGLSYVDVLIDLNNNDTVNIAATQSIAIITFHLLPNVTPYVTSQLKLESADAVFYVGGSNPFQYIDEKSGMTLQSGTVTLGYLVTTLAMKSVTATVEKPTTISSTFNDGGGNPIQGELIHYYVNSQEIPGSPVTTDANGVSSISYTPSDVGVFTMQASYIGNQPNGKYASSSATVSITVNKRPTALSLNVPPSIKVGETQTFAATLEKDDGTPLSGQTINFSVNSGPIGAPTTNASGTASIQYTFLSSPGTYIIKAEYAETAKYAGSSANVTRKTANIRTFLKLTITPQTGVKVDHAITLSATLKDESNNPLNGRDIDYYVNSQIVGSGTTNPSGVSSFTYYPSEASPSQGWDVEAQYAGDGPYSSSTDTGSIVINKLGTTLTLIAAPTTIAFGQTIIMTATLKDENTKAVSNSNLDYYIRTGNQWNKIGNKTTDANGVASLVYTLTTTGTLLAKANYTGDVSRYFGTEYIDPDIITVLKLNTTLTLNMPNTTKVGQSIIIFATLKDQYQNAIQDVTIDYNILTGALEQSIGSAKTDQNGVASLPLTLNGAGIFQIRAEYIEGTEYKGISETESLTVNQLMTTLTLNTPTTAKVGDTLTLIAILKDENSAALGGMAVKYSVYLNGTWSAIGNVATNQSGIASRDYLTQGAGTVRFKVEFNGDNNHAQTSSQEASVAINKVLTTLAIGTSNSTTQVQTSIKISATLMDEDTQPIPRSDIYYEILENNEWTSIGSRTTNFQGVATIDYQPDKAGTLIIRAVYNGDTKYASSTSEETNVTVIENTFNIYLIFWVVLIAAFSILVVVFVSRKIKSAEKQTQKNTQSN
jgi:hypothetical protein